MLRPIPRLPHLRPTDPESIFKPAEAEQRDEVDPAPPDPPSPDRPLVRPSALASLSDHGGSVPKTRATFHLRVDLLDELRDAVADLPGFTIASCVEEALRAYISYLRRKYNGSEPFPHRSSPIKRGRPRRLR